MDTVVMRKKVYYHDTDCGGVVYYANYLKYFEEARTEFLAQKGIDLQKLQVSGTFFAVREVSVKYRYPARYGELLDIVTGLRRTKNVTFNFYQYIKKETQLIVEADTQLVCIDREFNPRPIPEDVLSSLKDCLCLDIK